MSLIDHLHVLDGGFATELEFLGCNISGPLWSAHVLEDEPEKVVAVHRAYLEAGADLILTASYQVSRMGYAEYGLNPEQADRALLKSVELARQAIEEWRITSGEERRVLVASSLGPYGAMLHNGAEYHGNYGKPFDEIVSFHRERIAVLAAANEEARPDLLAFESLPSLEEAEAIAQAMAEWPLLKCWLSFTCRSGSEVAHGERLSQCAGLAAEIPQCLAVGINCTHPALIAGLIGEIKSATSKPVIVYPNSGEGWDAEKRTWTGANDAAGFGESARRWYNAGAQIVGGCCRTRPAHIAKIAASLRAE